MCNECKIECSWQNTFIPNIVLQTKMVTVYPLKLQNLKRVTQNKCQSYFFNNTRMCKMAEGWWRACMQVSSTTGFLPERNFAQGMFHSEAYRKEADTLIMTVEARGKWINTWGIVKLENITEFRLVTAYNAVLIWQWQWMKSQSFYVQVMSWCKTDVPVWDSAGTGEGTGLVPIPTRKVSLQLTHWHERQRRRERQRKKKKRERRPGARYCGTIV